MFVRARRRERSSGATCRKTRLSLPVNPAIRGLQGGGFGGQRSQRSYGQGRPDHLQQGASTMSNRTRTVYPSDMVAHFWADRSQDSRAIPDITSTLSGTPSIAMVPIFRSAATSKHKRGQAAVLFTTRGYSATTAGHKCMVEGACRHLTVFHVPDLNSRDHRKQLPTTAPVCGAGPPVCQARQRKPDILANCGDWLAKLTATPNSSVCGRLVPSRRYMRHGCRVPGNREEGTGTGATAKRRRPARRARTNPAMG